MTSIALPAGYDPGRLPGYLMGGDYWLNWYDGGQPAGVPSSCGAAQCPPESAPWTPEPGPVPEGSGGARGGGPTRRCGGPGHAGDRPAGGRDAAGDHGTGRLLGPRRMSGWLNLDGSLAMQLGWPWNE